MTPLYWPQGLDGFLTRMQMANAAVNTLGLLYFMRPLVHDLSGLPPTSYGASP
ncbi:MAG: hypothetical protein ABIS45_04655 [Burkholderiales bacterium]